MLEGIWCQADSASSFLNFLKVATMRGVAAINQSINKNRTCQIEHEYWFDLLHWIKESITNLCNRWSFNEKELPNKKKKKLICFWSNFAAKLNCKQSWQNMRRIAKQMSASVPAKTAVTAAAKLLQQEIKLLPAWERKKMMLFLNSSCCHFYFCHFFRIFSQFLFLS